MPERPLRLELLGPLQLLHLHVNNCRAWTCQVSSKITPKQKDAESRRLLDHLESSLRQTTYLQH